MRAVRSHTRVPLCAGVHLDGGRAAAQRLGPEGLERVPVGAGEAAERAGRDEEAPIEVAGRLLEAGGRIHDVAVKDDVALAAADLAADHRARVERGPDTRRYAELTLELRRRLVEGRPDREEAGDRARVVPPLGGRPRHHHLVAAILVDLAPLGVDGGRGPPEYAVPKAKGG